MLVDELLKEWKANGRRWQEASRHWTMPHIEAFHPAVYAADLYEQFLRRFPPERGAILATSLNPGPFGMAQTGIPFTDCRTARSELGLPVDIPGRAPPRLVRLLKKESGAWRSSYERSCIGVYRFLRLAWPDLRSAARNWIVLNTCPALFLRSDIWKNITPADAALRNLPGLQDLRRQAIKRFARVLRPRAVVCIGKDVEKIVGPVAEAELGRGRVLYYPHPARAVPELWARGLHEELRRRGLLQARP